MNIPLLAAQRRIAVAWFGFGAANFLILVGQTMFGDVFMSTDPKEDLSKLVWQWWLPQVLPTLGLVLGVLANLELVPAVRREAGRRYVTQFFLSLTFWSSVFYLVVLMLVLLGSVLSKQTAHERVAALQNAAYFLGPLQGLVGASLGVFFVSSHSDHGNEVVATAAQQGESPSRSI